MSPPASPGDFFYETYSTEKHEGSFQLAALHLAGKDAAGVLCATFRGLVHPHPSKK